jgi:hypothetical protein
MQQGIDVLGRLGISADALRPQLYLLLFIFFDSSYDNLRVSERKEYQKQSQ